MGTVRDIWRLIAGLLTLACLAGSAALGQEILPENPGLAFRPMVVRVIPHGPTGDDKPAGFGIVMGEREGQIYVATADHVVRDGTPDTLTDRPDIVFFHERPGGRRTAERLPERLPPERGDLAVLRIPRPDGFAAMATAVLPVANLAWGTPVWNVGRNGEWVVPTNPGGFQDQQPRTELLVFDRLTAPPGASGSAVVAEAGLVGMLVIDTGRGDIAYALPAEAIIRHFQKWGFPVGGWSATVSSVVSPKSEESATVRRAMYEWNARYCDQVANSRDPSKPPNVPGTPLGAHIILGALPPAEPIVKACRLAAEGFPETPRYFYQMGTILEIVGYNFEGRKAYWYWVAAEAAYRAAAEAGHQLSFKSLEDLRQSMRKLLHATGDVDRGYLSVQIQPVTDEIAQALGLDRARGALVASVVPDSPAARAGLQQGDVVVGFNGAPVHQALNLPWLVAEVGPEKRVEIRVWRNGEERTLQTTLVQMPQEEQ